VSLEPTFLEIVLVAEEFIGCRDEIEDPLDLALTEAGIGTVTGGGGGMGVCNIDVEVTDLDAGLAIIRRVLAELGVAESTEINQYKPIRRTYSVYVEK
jgi:hypothetical protein